MIIFFGGSFNPPHIGHKIIANIVYDEHKPNRFIISATPKPPHKRNFNLIDNQLRKEFCKQTFGNKFEITNIEDELPKPSYTLQTLEYLKNIDNDLFLLIGEDSLYNFKKWYEYKKILEISSLLVYPRNGFRTTKNDIIHTKIDAPIIEISSTYIRERVKKEKTIEGMVEKDIEEKIKQTYKNF
ncbi:MAG: nicotinate (nicotinamide) nucleotide adenylyltransferase [Thermotogota bacterium]